MWCLPSCSCLGMSAALSLCWEAAGVVGKAAPPTQFTAQATEAQQGGEMQLPASAADNALFWGLVAADSAQHMCTAAGQQMSPLRTGDPDVPPEVQVAPVTSGPRAGCAGLAG